jgi:hypothetical protein
LAASSPDSPPKLTGETSKLNELKRAIEIETQHLQELQEIRIVADALHILTQEHQENLKALEQKTAIEREALEKQQTIIRKSWQKEQEEYETALQEQNALLTAERQQETEDYQYELERTRKLETDEYDEIKRNLERELQASEKEKEKQWLERENNLTVRQAEFQEHQKKIDGFPKELEDAVKKLEKKLLKTFTKTLRCKLICLRKSGKPLNRVMNLKFNLWSRQFKDKWNR